MKIEHIMRGYTGSIGSYAMLATDFMMRGAGLGETLPLNFWKLPFVRDIFKYGIGEGTQSDYYDFRKAVEAVVNSVDKYKRQGQMEKAWSIQRQYESLYNMKDVKNAIDRRLINLRRERLRIVLSDMSVREKNAASEEIQRRMEYVLRNVPELYNKANVPVGFPFGSF